MAFGSHKNKFKSGFGTDGSQVNPKKGNYQSTTFADSQKIDTTQLKKV